MISTILFPPLSVLLAQTVMGVIMVTSFPRPSKPYERRTKLAWALTVLSLVAWCWEHSQ